jgi:hypothetical protein
MAIKIQGTTIINDETAYIDINGTTALKLPSGTTAQQPTGVSGMLRFNSETAAFEGFTGSAWGSLGGADETARTLATLALN